VSERPSGLVERSAEDGALTPVHDATPGRTCANCGAPVPLQFCPQCGQRAKDPDPTLRELTEELAAELLHWDGKLWTTLVTLARRPGELTSEYLSGKRARFISPLKLYLSASVLYFFLAAVGPPDPNLKPIVRFGDDDRATPAASVQGQVVAPVAVSAADTSAGGTKGVIARLGVRMRGGIDRASRNEAAFTAKLKDRLPTVVFVVLPAFAFAVGFAYRRQRRHFPQHLVFALHVHAMVFLGFALSETARFTRSFAVMTGVKLVVTAGLVVYIVAALRRVYGGSVARTLAKVAALGVVYLVFFAAGIAGLVAYTFLDF
jgi:hypothetical protein